MNYAELQAVAQEVLSKVSELGIKYQLYWYSPESRKKKPKTRIGYYERHPTGIHFEHGCKFIIVFPRLAFSRLEQIINKHLSASNQIAYRDDYKCKGNIGFDVYQRVHELKLFIEPDVYASEKLTVARMLKKGEYWADRQRKALDDVEPPLPEQQIANTMREVSIRFKKALAYLQQQNDPKARICVRRLTGVRHSMLRMNLAGDQTEKAGFSNLVFVFGSGKNIPPVVLPEEPDPDRKKRSDSISAKYKANPSNFKYYDKFGIFEVYDK